MEHKKKRAASALTFHTLYSEQGNGFLSQIITGDKTWVSHLTPELKQQSMDGGNTSSPKKHKFKQTISTHKIMCTVFWDRQGVLLVEFLPQGTAINSTAYCENMKKLCHMVQKKAKACLLADLCCFMTMLDAHHCSNSSPHHVIRLGTI
jgi:hypothetical protein